MARLREVRWSTARVTRALAPACRCCGLALTEVVADFGMAPIAGRVPQGAGEPFHPLLLLVCDDCRLVQLPDPSPPGGAPPTAPWQAEEFAAGIVASLHLDRWTPVAEIGPGAMLPAFARLGVAVMRLPALGFGAASARRLRADGPEPVLLLVPDAMAEAPSLHDFAAGLREWLAPGGVAVLEVPALQRIIEGRRLDLIRHGRLSYFTLSTAEMVLAQHGLVIFDVARTGRDGGGLRLFARHAEDRGKPLTPAIDQMRREEAAAGLGAAGAYRAFACQVVEAKCALLDFLIGAHRAGKRVAALGVPQGGTTLLTFCGVGPELLGFTGDDDASRHGRTLPGTRIPIRPSAAIAQEKPDFVLILSAMPTAEAELRLRHIRDWGGRIVVPLPTIDIF